MGSASGIGIFRMDEGREGMDMRKLVLTTLCMSTAIASAEAAAISADSSIVHGGTIILISGEIVPGDEQQFRAVAETVSGDVPVVLRSPGGSVQAAIAIGRMVQARGLTTFVGRLGQCSSACTLIWLSGRHAVIQRNSYLAFHAPSVNGHYSPQGAAVVASYLRELGLTEDQILYVIGTPPALAHRATEAEVAAIGIHPQVVSSLLGAWKGCSAKFCLAVP